MSKKEEKLIVHTITKAKFDKLSISQKRKAIVKDVLDRIKLGQLIARTGDFCQIITQGDVVEVNQVSEKLKSLDLTCEVCAKGGLFTTEASCKEIIEPCNSRFFTTSYFTKVLFTVEEPVGNFCNPFENQKQINSIYKQLKSIFA